METEEKTEIVETIKRLAASTLKFKWIEAKNKNLNRLISPCPFCLNVLARKTDCSNCFVPPIICGDQGISGLIGMFRKNYMGSELCDLHNEDYALMRRLLIDLAKNGDSSKSITIIANHFHELPEKISSQFNIFRNSVLETILEMQNE